MAGQPADEGALKRAEEFKKKGNDCFVKSQYEQAEKYYSIAINSDPSNPLLYTNRAMCYLRLQVPSPPLNPYLTTPSTYSLAASDANSALSLLSLQLASQSPLQKSHEGYADGQTKPIIASQMKANFFLAQALSLEGESQKALEVVKKAYEQCVEDMSRGGKGSSLATIMDWGARIRREVWLKREKERQEKARGSEELLNQLVGLLERERDNEIGDSQSVEVEEVRRRWEEKIKETRRTFGAGDSEEAEKREMPDWAWDGISFNLMLDPVMTKTGQSYERTSILKHLEKSETDPLTREPLTKEDLRPNLGLRAAVEDFVRDNGWAVDW